MDQDKLFQHYRQRRQRTSLGWVEHPDQWPISGISLAQRIRPGERVIDIGCANNVFKNILPDVTGIDPAFAAADHQCRIEDYEPTELFDVAFCLSIFNWGTHDEMHQQISAAVRCLKPQARIYLRLAENAQGGGVRGARLDDQQRTNSGLFLDQDEVTPYKWSFHRVQWWADHMRFRVTELCWDYNHRADRSRIFSVWERG